MACSAAGTEEDVDAPKFSILVFPDIVIPHFRWVGISKRFR